MDEVFDRFMMLCVMTFAACGTLLVVIITLNAVIAYIRYLFM